MDIDLHDVSIRTATTRDLPAVLDLWSTAAAQPTVTDGIGPLRTLVSRDPGALLVAQVDGDLVGSLIAAWDGWRGSFYRLAVRPDCRRRGLATRLVRDGELRLRKRGAMRLDAIVTTDEQHAMAFWTAAGYTCQPGRARFVRTFASRADGAASSRL